MSLPRKIDKKIITDDRLRHINIHDIGSNTRDKQEHTCWTALLMALARLSDLVVASSVYTRGGIFMVMSSPASIEPSAGILLSIGTWTRRLLLVSVVLGNVYGIVAECTYSYRKTPTLRD